MTEIVPNVPAESVPPANAEVNNLTNKDIKYRSKYKQEVAAKEELARKLEQAEAEKREYVQIFESNSKVANDRVIQAELKALAVSEGIKDLDVAKLIDLTGVKLDEAGNVVGLKEAVTDFKTRKPDFFGTNKLTSSSSNAGNITDTSPPKLDAKNMSKEEYEIERRKLFPNMR